MVFAPAARVPSPAVERSVVRALYIRLMMPGVGRLEKHTLTAAADMIESLRARLDAVVHAAAINDADRAYDDPETYADDEPSGGPP